MKEMKEKIYDARTGMEYILIGDYYLPALKLPRTRPIGRWGMLHKAYLKLRKPAYYQSLSLIHISEPTRRTPISYAVFCLKKKKRNTQKKKKK